MLELVHMTNCAARCATVGIAFAILPSLGCDERARTTRAPLEAGPDSQEAAADSPSCSADTSGPWSTRDQPRRVLPWTLVSPPDGAAPSGVVTDADTAACVRAEGGIAAASGCDTASASASNRCRGTAVAHRAGSGLELALADGSVFRWDPARVTNPVAPPAVVDGSAVWIDYSYQYGFVCPFCGAYHNAELRIVDCTDGKTLWIGREGHTLDDVSSSLVTELFGTTSHEQLVCTLSGTAGCYSVERSLFDHVLDTSPAQVLHHAKLGRVVTPGGEYDVVWAHSTEVRRFNTNCNDGPGVASDTGFAASQIRP